MWPVRERPGRAALWRANTSASPYPWTNDLGSRSPAPDGSRGPYRTNAAYPTLVTPVDAISSD